MNSRERVFALLEGKAVDRTPNFNILMGFSARFGGHTYREYASDYRILCDSDLKCAEEFSIDLLSAISDPMREAEGFGASVTMPENDVPYSPVPLVDDIYNVRNILKTYDPFNGKRTEDRLKAVEYFKKHGKNYAVGGWVEGAFAECCDLRGINDFLADVACEEEEAIHDFLRIANEQAIRFAVAQVKAGADIVGIGDAATSLISPDMYKEFALPYQKEIVAAVHAAGGRTKLHICGNTTNVLPYMIETGTDIVDLDWMVDLKRAKEIIGDRHTVISGNYDPVAVLLQGTPDLIRASVLACKETVKTNYISSAGCEVPPATPHENLRAVAEALKCGD
ncbi:MAG: uroporphyrinogen decarboxylase family protein [Clostridia bacterium]|nr:uroporphyrinogen decarboxylase family protein [Clostridia bacterium]